jgi:hypothetical protein
MPTKPIDPGRFVTDSNKMRLSERVGDDGDLVHKITLAKSLLCASPTPQTPNKLPVALSQDPNP